MTAQHQVWRSMPDPYPTFAAGRPVSRYAEGTGNPEGRYRFVADSYYLGAYPPNTL